MRMRICPPLGRPEGDRADPPGARAATLFVVEILIALCREDARDPDLIYADVDVVAEPADDSQASQSDMPVLLERSNMFNAGRQHHAERRFERRAVRAAGARSLHRGAGGA